MLAKLGMICLVAALSGDVAGQTRPSTTAPTTRPAEVGSRQSARELSFEQTPLADVVQHLRDTYRLNIFVNWKMLQTAGVNRETPITVRARDITLRKALQLILTSAGGQPPLDFSVSEGVISISTRQDLESRPETRVYDITDLLLPEVSAEGRGQRESR